MTLDDTIQKSFEDAFDAFIEALRYFQPYKGDNSFLERNLTCYLSCALKKALEEAHVYYEVPVTAGRRGQIDSIVITPQYIFIIEAKRLNAPSIEALTAIDEDLSRFTEVAQNPQDILNMTYGGPWRPNQFIYMIVTDCWDSKGGRHELGWWSDEVPSQLPNGVNRNLVHYRRRGLKRSNPTRDERYESYHWLVAWKISPDEKGT